MQHTISSLSDWLLQSRSMSVSGRNDDKRNGHMELAELLIIEGLHRGITADEEISHEEG